MRVKLSRKWNKMYIYIIDARLTFVDRKKERKRVVYTLYTHTHTYSNNFNLMDNLIRDKIPEKGYTFIVSSHPSLMKIGFIR